MKKDEKKYGVQKLCFCKLVRRSKLLLAILLFPVMGFAMNVKLTLETTMFEEEDVILWTTIMQRGEKLRLEETLPNSNELGLVIISDGKECWHIPILGKPSRISPIKDALELAGIPKSAIKKEAIVGVKVKSAPQVKTLKEKSIRYKDYIETEDLGWLPGIIETYDSNGELEMRTEIKNIKEEVGLQDELFDKNKVKFSARAKELAKKIYPE